jgi:hypothetical protein
VLESNGQNEARAYAVMEVPPPRVVPPVDAERVQIGDPRQVVTAPSGTRRPGLGPRNAEQASWPLLGPPGVDLPDALPATKAQRVLLDPELVARWRVEAKMKEGA